MPPACREVQAPLSVPIRFTFLLLVVVADAMSVAIRRLLA